MLEMYRNLYVSNRFGDSLPLAEFLQLPDVEKWKMAKGEFDIYKVLERKLKILTEEERQEYERFYKQHKEDKHQERMNKTMQLIRG